MAYEECVAERVREIVRGRQGITQRKMFGGLAFMSNGHMFIGVLGSTLMARIGTNEYEQALAMPHVREMDFTGKPMRGYVFIEPGGFETDDSLKYWVNKSYGFAASLPPKLSKT